MKLKRLFGLLSLLVMIPIWAIAQTVTVKGVVKDAAGEPMPGVSVVQSTATQTGTVTDIDGNYQIAVNADA